MGDSAKSSNPHSNWLKISRLLEKNCETLREIFLRRWKDTFGLEWNESDKQYSAKLAKELKVNEGTSLRSGQKKNLQTGDSSKWDISLLASLLRFPRWEQLTTSSSLLQLIKTQNAHIASLTDIRNKIAHSTSSSMSYEEFQPLWNQLSTISANLGVPKTQMEEIYAQNFESFADDKRLQELKAQAAQKVGQKKWSEALTLYTQALNLHIAPREKAILYSNRCVCLLNLKGTKDIKNALADAKLCVSLWPDWFKGHYRLGAAYAAKRNFHKALAAFDDSLLLESNDEVKTAREAVLDDLLRYERHEHEDVAGAVSIRQYFEKELQDRGMDASAESVRKMIELAASSGSEGADCAQGELYLFGDPEGGKHRDYDMAIRYFTKAANKGDAFALYRLGSIYAAGHGVPKDLQKAQSYYEQAADSTPKKSSNSDQNYGIGHAQCALGLWYLNGIRFPRDLIKAAEYFQKALDNGAEPGYVNLGCCYWIGEGVKQNISKAYDLFLAAVSKFSSGRAMFNIGDMYAAGDVGTRPNLEKAREWYQKALEAGFSFAQHRLNNLKTIEPADFEDLMQLRKDLENLSVKSFDPKNLVKKVKVSDDMDKWNLERLEKYARTSVTARNYYRARLHALKSDDCLMNEDIEGFIHHFAEAVIISEIVLMIPHHAFTVYIAIAENCLAEKPDSRNALIACSLLCQAMGNVKSAENYLTRGTKKFPNEPFFWRNRAAFRMAMRDYAGSVSDSKRAAELEPEEPGHYYALANAYRNLDPKDGTLAIAAYKRYLELAPSDDRQFADGYFGLANVYLAQGDKTLAQEAYDNGLKAKKLALPLFAGEASSVQSAAQTLLKLADDKRTAKHPKKKEESAAPQPLKKTPNDARLNSTIRKEIIIKQRTMYAQMRIQSVGQYVKSVTSAANKKGGQGSLANLKPIYVEEIISAREKVYQGRILSGTIIDAPFMMSGTYIIVEDDFGHVVMAAVYDYVNTQKEADATFAVGTKIEITHPYFKTAMDGTKYIRVENPKSVFLHPKEDICYFCTTNILDSAAAITCANCKRSRYCSAKCQARDLNEYQHKLICDRRFFQ